MQKIKTTVKKTIAYLAKKSANMEANTACPCIGFQPKEPQTVKSCVSSDAGGSYSRFPFQRRKHYG